MPAQQRKRLAVANQPTRLAFCVFGRYLSPMLWRSLSPVGRPPSPHVFFRFPIVRGCLHVPERHQDGADAQCH